MNLFFQLCGLGRLALARALYQDRDVYLIDDIFSAVDAHVSSWIIQHAIAGSLMSLKTCIVVTKSRQCIELADTIINIKKGGVVGIQHGSKSTLKEELDRENGKRRKVP